VDRRARLWTVGALALLTATMIAGSGAPALQRTKVTPRIAPPVPRRPAPSVDAIATSPAALFSHQLALWPYGARWSVLSLARVTGAGVVSISGRGR